jgi:uncharacterized protein YciI
MSKSEQTSSLQRKRELDGALLYLVETFSKPEATGNRAEYRQAHFEYSEKLSVKGILVGGGPVVNEMDRKPSGAGFWILKAASMKEAIMLIEDDPFVQNGFRDFRIRLWRLSEGLMKSQKDLQVL